LFYAVFCPPCCDHCAGFWVLPARYQPTFWGKYTVTLFRQTLKKEHYLSSQPTPM
jgi:hypothetical protein